MLPIHRSSRTTVALMLVGVSLIASACVADAPRAIARRSTAELGHAARQFGEMVSMRIRLTGPSVEPTDVEVRRPDRYRIRAPSGSTARRLTDTAAAPAPLVVAIREALEAPGRLEDAAAVSYAGPDAILGYQTTIWSFALGPDTGRVWLSVHDGLPRRLELQGPSGRRLYEYRDFDASIVVDTAGRQD